MESKPDCLKSDNDAAYHDFARKTTLKVASYREPADLKKVDQPEILGDIMKSNWSTEGDGNVVCD